MENESKSVLNIAIIGAKATGKTTYIYYLWKNKIFKTSENSKDTMEYMKSISTNIEEGNTGSTSKIIKELNFSYQHPKLGKLDLSIDDYDGDFTEDIHGNESLKDKKKLLKHVKESEGIIFFIPYIENTERLENFTKDIDEFLRYAKDDYHSKDRNKSQIPATIAISMWDRFTEDDTDTREACDTYLQSSHILKRVVKAIKEEFEYTETIAISSTKSYNLSQPIEFAMSKTFERWYNEAIKLNQDKKYKELTEYLSLRYENIKNEDLQKKYNFVELYDKAQQEYAKTLNNNFKMIEIISVMRKTEEAKQYFKTQPKLLDEIEKKIKNKKIKILAIVFFFLFLVALIVSSVFRSSNTTQASSAYSIIKNMYDDNTSSSIDIDQQIDGFLKKYPLKSTLLYPQKIADMSNDLKACKNRLRSRANFMEEKKWVRDSEICLGSCKGENGVKKIDKLLEYINTTKITKERVTRDKIAKKLQTLRVKLSKSINKKSDVTKLLDSVTLDEIIEIVDIAFQNKELTISHLTKLYSKELSTNRGKSILDELRESDSKEEMLRMLSADMAQYLKLTKSGNRLIDNIQNTRKYSELKYINYDQYYKLDESQRVHIHDAIDIVMNKFVKSLINMIPQNKINQVATKKWLESIRKIEKFKISKINYSYNLSESDKRIVSKIKKRYENIDKAFYRGVSKIKVSIKFYKGSIMGWGCGWLEKGDDIEINGFSNKLPYTNTSECIDNKIVFNNKISLKPRRYFITIREVDLIWDETTQGVIVFSKEDIIALMYGIKISKRIVGQNIELSFSKSRY